MAYSSKTVYAEVDLDEWSTEELLEEIKERGDMNLNEAGLNALIVDEAGLETLHLIHEKLRYNQDHLPLLKQFLYDHIGRIS